VLVTHDPYSLPNDLPVPVDDGACAHLTGLELPDVRLVSTDGRTVSIRGGDRTTVLYVYPKSGRPGVDPPPGWNDTPGMRGCTPQSCAFRDLHAELEVFADVYGISSQTPDEQREFAQRLELRYPLLSDADFVLEREIGLPAVQVTEGLRVYRRATLVVEDGRVEKVFYPVFPPDDNAADVLSYLRSRMATR
jgi:peroxiredoxin